jgi:hypothetical protein
MEKAEKTTLEIVMLAFNDRSTCYFIYDLMDCIFCNVGFSAAAAREESGDGSRNTFQGYFQSLQQG